MRLALLVAALAIAAPAPVLSPLDEAGFGRVLASHKGKVVLFDFWATWCEPCREELPRLVELERKLRGRGFVLITISADEPEQAAGAAALLAKLQVRPPLYIKNVRDNEVFINSIDRKWSGALPALFLYGRDGRRAASFIGETENAELTAAIEKLL